MPVWACISFFMNLPPTRQNTVPYPLTEELSMFNGRELRVTAMTTCI
jgi:hypothetical protein